MLIDSFYLQSDGTVEKHYVTENQYKYGVNITILDVLACWSDTDLPTPNISKSQGLTS